MSKSTLVTRGTQALAAFAIVSTFVSGPFAAVASAQPAAAGVQQQQSQATVEEKLAAARLVGLAPTPEELAKNDLRFTIYLWDSTDEKRDRHVQEAAKLAFTSDHEDPEACYRFIVRDVYPAHERDLNGSAPQQNAPR